MKKITAIVRTSCLDNVVKSLEEVGIRGMTISEIKGIGTQVRLNNPYTIHDKLEIIVPEDKVDPAVAAIVNRAYTGFPGDGMVTVSPVDYTIKIRTGEKR